MPARLVRFVLVALACGSASTAQSQNAGLTLACKGTTRESVIEDAKPYPISMDIIVNFTTRTVRLNDTRLMITVANDATVVFGGHQQILSSMSSIEGSIDRVTGDVKSTSTTSDLQSGKVISRMVYALQCK